MLRLRQKLLLQELILQALPMVFLHRLQDSKIYIYRLKIKQIPTILLENARFSPKRHTTKHFVFHLGL